MTPTPTACPQSEAAGTRLPQMWRNRDYNLLMSGRTLAVIGSAMTGLAVMLLAYDLTRDAGAASVVMSFQLIGMAIMSLPAGALVDRWNRKTVMVATALVQSALLVTVPLALLGNALTIPHLCAATFGVGALGTFYGPAEQASLRRIVRPDQLGTAMAVNQARGSLGSIVGPPLAGVLYGVSRLAPMLGDAVAHLIAGTLAAFVRSDLRPQRAEQADAQRKRGALWREVAEGLAFVWGNQVLRVVGGIAAMLNLAFATIMTSVILGMQVAGEAPTTIGLLETAVGAAGLMGALASATILRFVPVGRLFILGLAFSTLMTGLMITWAQPWQLMLLLGAVLLIFPAVNAGLSAYFMAVTPDRMQGRAMSALGLLSMGLMPVGNMVGGFVLEHVGRAAAIGVGVGLLTLIVVVATLSTTVRGIPRASEFEVVD